MISSEAGIIRMLTTRLFQGEEFEVKAKCVINATGPFTDSIRKMGSEKMKPICQPSSGVHIILPDYYRYLTTLGQP